MNRLFIKIFLGFWLTVLAVVVAGHLVTTYFASTPEYHRKHSPWELKKESNRLLHRAENIFQREGPQGLIEWRTKHKGRGPFQLHFTQDINSMPEPVRVVAEKLTPRRSYIVESDAERKRLYKARLLHDRDKQPWILVVEIPPLEPQFVHLLNRYIWLRFLVATLISALVCYGLVRFWIRPVDRLRQATRQLADGDLSSRVTVPEKGGDAFAELGRDFNNMAEELRTRIEGQRQLVRDISHELRSPLGRIQAALALARAKQQDTPFEIDRIERECARLNEMIDQLLVVPDEKIALDDVVDLSELARILSEENQPQSEQKQISVELKLEEPLLINCHAESLYRAIDNILRNAIRHTPENGLITITSASDSEQITLRIRDSGPGVPEDQLEKIFETFYRVEAARDRESGGYGLGLSIAHRAVAQHDGLISATNTHPGLEIKIALPISLLCEQ